MRVWIIGAGGLFGSALTRTAQAAGDRVFTSNQTPWHDDRAALASLAADARSFFAGLNSGDAWAIAWAAGRVTTSSTHSEADAERAVFEKFLQSLVAERENLSDPTPGSFLLASSAGGIYAGSSSPPFTSATAAAPLSPYGELKLAQEELVTNSLGSGFTPVIARIANLYGPGQDVIKLQGLISRLALSAVTREPLTMFVPLDTLRDYIFVDDAAAIARHWMTVPDAQHPIRLIASGVAASLGQVIGMVQDVAHTRIPIAYGVHPSAAGQARDMRLIPDQDDWTRHFTAMQLPAGMKLTYQDILTRSQDAAVTPAVR